MKRKIRKDQLEKVDISSNLFNFWINSGFWISSLVFIVKYEDLAHFNLSVIRVLYLLANM